MAQFKEKLSPFLSTINELRDTFIGDEIADKEAPPKFLIRP